MSSLALPARFGRYRLTSRIATGGMAEVYVGRRVDEHGAQGPLVAVKRLLPHLTSDSQMVRLFLNEARITAQIHHPNVVRILDLGAEDGEPFIAMELLEGHSFADLRQQAAENGRRVPLGITLRVLTEACRGLDAAHRAQDDEGRKLCIVHRDFTPDNIHVGVNGDVKVIDFGIAKSQQWATGTEPGTLMGKFFYMSPEMIAGQSVDHRADLFAAGVMLYEQLCGRRPFTGNSTDAVVRRIAEGKPRRPTEFDPSVPFALEAICLTALNRSPDHRFPSLQEFISAIEAVGGLAQLATREELAAYVGEVFPADQDDQRQVLRRARQADPSLPDAGSIPKLSLAPAPAPPSRRKGWRVAALTSVVLVAAFGVWAWSPWAPAKNPAQRLSAAERTTDAAERRRTLADLAEEPRATAGELARAAELLLQVGADRDALALAEGLQARYPKDTAGPLLEAKAAIRLRFGRRAERALERAARQQPSSAEPDLLLAELRELQGDRFAALDALARAAEKRPGDLTLAARRGYLLSQTGQLDEAAEVLGQVVSGDADPSSAAELAFVRFRQDRLEEALTLLRKAIKRAPELSAAHYYLGAVLYRKGDVEGAERAYREADRLAPQDPRPLLALCELQARNRDGELPKTQRLIAERFPQSSAQLLTQCAR